LHPGHSGPDFLFAATALSFRFPVFPLFLDQLLALLSAGKNMGWKKEIIRVVSNFL